MCKQLSRSILFLLSSCLGHFCLCLAEALLAEAEREKYHERASKQERCRCKSLEDVVLNRSRLVTANSFAASKYLFSITEN